MSTGLIGKDRELENSLRAAVIKAYGSLDEPSFSFVEKTAKRRPYDPLVSDLKALGFEIEETTDINEDVSFCYVLRARGSQWSLQLSMIGPFAVFFRLERHGEPIAEITEVTGDLIDLEKDAVVVFRQSGVLVLGESILRRRIPLSMFYTEKQDVRFYQALFSDVEILPWPERSPL